MTKSKNTKTLSVTKQIDFEAGHRLPFHHSKCKNLHGHHYVIEFSLEGIINTTEGNTEQGMVVEFADIKKIAKEVIKGPWDHAFIAYEKDHAVIEFLNSLKDHKTVLTPLPPTAEHLADLAFDKLNEAIQKKYGQTLQLKRLRLYETPTSWAEVQA